MSFGPDHMRHFKEDLTVAFNEDSVEVQGASLERCIPAVSWDLSYGRCHGVLLLTDLCSERSTR